MDEDTNEAQGDQDFMAGMCWSHPIRASMQALYPRIQFPCLFLG